MFCTSQPAASAWTRTPTRSAGAARPPCVEHLENTTAASKLRPFWPCRQRFRLACAFAQSGFEALQEAVEQQLPPGRRRRATDTPAPVAGGIRWVAARRQGTHQHVSVCSMHGRSCGSPSPLSLRGGIALLRRALPLSVQLRELHLHPSKLLLRDQEQT